MDSFSKRGDGRRASSDASTAGNGPSSLRQQPIGIRRPHVALATAGSDLTSSAAPSVERGAGEPTPDSALEPTFVRRRLDAPREESPGRSLEPRADKRNSSGSPARVVSGVAARPATETQEIVYAARDGVIAVLGCCTLIVHLEAPTPGIINAMVQGYTKALAQADKFAHLSVVEANAGLLPPGETREAIGAVIQRFDKRVAAAAIVYEEDGFRATAVRSIVTGLCMASRTTHPTRVFSEAGAACSWLSGLLPLSLAMPDTRLLQALRELREPRSGTR